MVNSIARHTKNNIDIVLARRLHLDFMKYCWQRNSPFIVGHHTRAICDRIDRAIEDFKKGKSSFIAVKIPFRHGKSDIVSRYLPPHFLGQFPDEEVIVAGYSASLTAEFSKFGRRLLQHPRYSQLYPDIRLAKDEQSVDVWGLHKKLGKAHWVGLGGSITGKGGSCIIIDDFFKGREEAESETMRDKVWESFANDIMTRRAPVCIVIVLATPWHVDDLFGRIKKKMDEDPLFPEFEEFKYPARHPTQYRKINGTKYLFPERFTEEWYESQYSTLGPYRAAGLMDCDPVVREGNMFEVDNIQFYDEPPVGIRWSRGWDLASTEKQKIKEDPDYTASIKLGVEWKGNEVGEPVPVLYIDDFTIEREAAPKRDKRIKRVTKADGEHVQVGIEGYGAYKDTFEKFKTVLHGVRHVHKIRLPGDKVTRAEALEPVFHAGNVFMRKAPWNAELLKYLTEFPGGAHDDPVDALVTAYAVHKPYVKSVYPMMGGLTAYDFSIGWGKRDKELSFNYAALVLKKDLSLFTLGAMWDSSAGELYVYQCNRYEDLDMAAIANDLILRYQLGTYGVDKILCNDLMVSGDGVEKTAKEVLRGEFKKKKVVVSLRESLKHDMWGSIGIMNQLCQGRNVFFEKHAERALLQCQMWSIDNGKPAIVDDGYGLCLNLIVSELKKKHVFEEKLRRRDYIKDTEYNKRKGDRYGKGDTFG